jgi:hypothetical protein
MSAKMTSKGAAKVGPALEKSARNSQVKPKARRLDITDLEDVSSSVSRGQLRGSRVVAGMVCCQFCCSCAIALEAGTDRMLGPA